jgi:hypothetical protein
LTEELPEFLHTRSEECVIGAQAVSLGISGLVDNDGIVTFIELKRSALRVKTLFGHDGGVHIGQVDGIPI